MSISESKLQEIATLAALNVDDPVITKKLINDVEKIMQLVDKLRSIETKDVLPLSHPLDTSARLREDEVSIINEIDDLAMNAPFFSDDGFFLVPKDSGNQDVK